jgi:hypothetical protein
MQEQEAVMATPRLTRRSSGNGKVRATTMTKTNTNTKGKTKAKTNGKGKGKGKKRSGSRRTPTRSRSRSMSQSRSRSRSPERAPSPSAGDNEMPMPHAVVLPPAPLAMSIPGADDTRALVPSTGRVAAPNRSRVSRDRSRLAIRQSRSQGRVRCKVPALPTTGGGFTCPSGHVLFDSSESGGEFAPCCLPLHKADATIQDRIERADDRLDVLETMVGSEHLSERERLIAARQMEQINVYVGELMLEQELLCDKLSPDDCRASEFCEHETGWLGTDWWSTCGGKNLRKVGIQNFYTMGTKLAKLATEKIELEMKSLEGRADRKDRQRLAFFRALRNKFGEQLELITKAMEIEKACNDKIDAIQKQLGECSYWVQEQRKEEKERRINLFGPSKICTAERKVELENALVEAIEDKKKRVSGVWTELTPYIVKTTGSLLLAIVATVASKVVLGGLAELTDPARVREVTNLTNVLVKWQTRQSCVASTASVGAGIGTLGGGLYGLLAGGIGSLACLVFFKS